MYENNDNHWEKSSGRTEMTLLDDIMKELPEKILIVSDLHLNIGRDPATGTYSLIENFLADETFARWLKHYHDHAPKPALLVLNGDIFDFDRVTAIPETDKDFTDWSEYLDRLGVKTSPAELRKSVNRVEKRYGLRTHDYKTVWKLKCIFSGHAAFFKALADWLTAGGRLVFVKGNHDLELHWPLVRLAIRAELTVQGAGADQTQDNIAFCDDGFTIGNVYIEHGHQYEEITRVEGGPVLDNKPDQINLPLGSFINRYCVNKVERLAPFIDNIKPITGALLALLRARPLSVFKIYFRSWRFIFRALVMRRVFNSAFFLVLAGLIVPVAALIFLALLLASQAARTLVTGWMPAWLQISGIIGGILFPIILPYLVGAVLEIIRQLPFFKSKNHLREQVKKKLDEVFSGYTQASKVYAAMGHTHVQDVLKLADQPLEQFYVDSGAWIPLWPENRRDLIGRTIYSYISFDSDTKGMYRKEFLQWDDHAEKPREARILVSPFR